MDPGGISEARAQARWWVGCYGLMGAAALTGLSLFSPEGLNAWATVVYIVALVLGFLLATEMLLSTRRLFPRLRQWKDLSDEEQSLSEGLGYSVDQLETLATSSGTRDMAWSIRASVVREVHEGDAIEALRIVGRRLRAFSGVILGMFAVAGLLHFLPSAQVPACESDLRVCASLPLSDTPLPVSVRLQATHDPGGRKALSLYAQSLEDAGCKVAPTMPAIAVGGDYLNPIVVFTTPGCGLGPTAIPAEIAYVIPDLTH